MRYCSTSLTMLRQNSEHSSSFITPNLFGVKQNRFRNLAKLRKSKIIKVKKRVNNNREKQIKCQLFPQKRHNSIYTFRTTYWLRRRQGFRVTSKQHSLFSFLAINRRWFKMSIVFFFSFLLIDYALLQSRCQPPFAQILELFLRVVEHLVTSWNMLYYRQPT